MKKYLFIIVVLSILIPINMVYGQNNNYNYMALPPRDSVWINAGWPPGQSQDEGKTFGYWFIAPTDLTITGLEVDSQTGQYGGQTFQVIKFNGKLALYPDTGFNFTTLYYGKYNSNVWIDSVNIPVSAGDTIGIIGQVGTTISLSSYNTPFTTMIGNDTVLLNALYSKDGNLYVDPVSWYTTFGAGSRIGRIGMFYSLGNSSGVLNFGTENGWRIYPNPAADQLIIQGLEHAATYTISNLTGQILLSGKLSTSKKPIDIHQLSPGMYWIQIQSGAETQHQKFIKL